MGEQKLVHSGYLCYIRGRSVRGSGLAEQPTEERQPLITPLHHIALWRVFPLYTIPDRPSPAQFRLRKFYIWTSVSSDRVENYRVIFTSFLFNLFNYYEFLYTYSAINCDKKK